MARRSAGSGPGGRGRRPGGVQWWTSTLLGLGSVRIRLRPALVISGSVVNDVTQRLADEGRFMRPVNSRDEDHCRLGDVLRDPSAAQLMPPLLSGLEDPLVSSRGQSDQRATGLVGLLIKNAIALGLLP